MNGELSVSMSISWKEEGYIERNSRYQVDAEGTFSTETYLNRPEETYGGKITEFQGKNGTNREGEITFAKQTSGVLLPEYRLPTEVEWEYAANALNGLREYNNIRGRKKYPWDGEYTRDGSRNRRGDQLANFKQGKGDYGGVAGWSDDGADITAEVKSYPPNDFGLYDMAGNVAEWVADVYRPIVDDEANDFNYYRGNVYTKNAIGDDGKVMIVKPNEVKYDTLSNGRIIARNLPGQLAKVAVDDQETYLRPNFSQSDNRGYRDGDPGSSRFFDRFGDDITAQKKMYNSPKHNVSTDSTGNMIREYDKSSKRTSLINDEVRVYKGGSWRDRAYWLDPAQRRYLPQYMATDYIGFRNAMSRLGSKTKEKKKPRG